MAILFSWAPAGFVEEHEKDVSLFLSVDLVQFLIERAEQEQAGGHEVILDALVLKVAVHCLDKFQISKCKTDQFIWSFILIQSHN